MPEPASSAFAPRNLVALSDGTGNSAAKLHKTNVWRLYEALDVLSGDQLAMYDDGVGTASFRPLALLGGVFGHGLKRNVLDLYLFLCRNHRADPANPLRSDRIFVFGFSRGAYTARVLAGLVDTVGLVDAASEFELRRLARWAYRRYRAERFPHSLLARGGRLLRDTILRTWEALRGLHPADPSATRRPEISFLGLWDTVAAYGLPIEELTRGWERWIWPVLPKDRVVPKSIQRACHALALDDERQTFFPLLWTEEHEPLNEVSTHLEQERVTQVWFAGMHSDVGGGYPDDGLAFTPLVWIAQEAWTRGLRFRRSLCAHDGRLPDAWTERASAGGPLHNSRQGLGASYRFHPRPIERLTNDAAARVHIVRPKIHISVFERLSQNIDGYAPLTLPRRYAIVTRDGRVLGNADPTDSQAVSSNPYEHPSQQAARRTLQEAVLSAVWLKRAVYHTNVAVIVIVALLPLSPIRDDFTFLGAPESTLSGLVGLIQGATPLLREAFSSAIRLADVILPLSIESWFEYYSHRPFQLMLGTALITTLSTWSARLTLAIRDRMREVFRTVGIGAAEVDVLPAPRDAIYRIRTSRLYIGAFHSLSEHLVPNVFGLTMIALFVVVPLRTIFELRSRAGLLTASTCGQGTPDRRAGETETFAMWPHLLCNATGLSVQKGQRYRVEIALPEACSADERDAPATTRRTGAWTDWTIPVTGTEGFSSLHAPGSSTLQKLVMTLAVPMRREITADWLVPVAEIGTSTPLRIPLDDDTFVAGQDGPLALWVNDLILPCPGWDCLYRNNAGGPATVRITRAEAPPLPTLRARPTCP